ncbi:MAG: antitoxin Xre/MbcA/ParS toxin-binding domain-containing protein [Pedobacter sp.]
MPFEISIKIQNPLGTIKEVLRVTGHNAKSPDGDRENPLRVYRYSAEDLDTSQVTEGEVLHVRDEGITILASIILQDVAKKEALRKALIEGEKSGFAEYCLEKINREIDEDITLNGHFKVDLHESEGRQRLAKIVFQLFDLWQLDTRDQAALLGLSVDSLSKYRNGAPFDDSQDLFERAGHLLGIHKSLRITFPHNIDLAYRWVTQSNRHFDGATPLDVMKKEGILAVRRYLDRDQF